MFSRFKSGLSVLALTSVLGLAACGEKEPAIAPLGEADAAAFMERAEAQLSALEIEVAQALWVQANFITQDTNAMAARVDEKFTTLAVKLANEAKAFNDVEMNVDLARKLQKLKQGLVLPAPADAAKTAELSRLKSKLESTYATGKVEIGGKEKTLGDLSDTMATSRNPEELLAAWDGWRTVSKPMAADYTRLVEIANEGSKELGFTDVGAQWRAGYDMDADAFAAEADRLWGQVKPLYDSLQCHVRAELSDFYGERNMPGDGTIPAHFLGNMWAQTWGNVYDLAKPEGNDSTYDLTALLVEKGYDAQKMAKAADDFFISMGFQPMPETFWERSLFTKPADREVVCHASAWDIDAKDDIRIKMCTKVNGEDFVTIHHEIGHNIYQRAYKNQSYLHRTGAHDGFHEAIGDMIALSITPSYLKEVGLLDELPSTDADTALLLAQAMDRVAFLPFGLLVDKWRWQVFNGTLTPETYNEGWWKLRREYQGVSAPNDRPADAFDPGAKFHIPGNTPYMRYFLAHILQFQFHRAACEQAGFEGPLHQCSVYGNEDVGKRFNAMMEMGASRPWPEALEAFTGNPNMDASAIVDYFAPLKSWLDEQNKDRTCGW